MNCEIFISYKCSDENGNKTPDYQMASELHGELRVRNTHRLIGCNMSGTAFIMISFQGSKMRQIYLR